MKQERLREEVCQRSHYTTIVAAQKDAEVYQLGDLDCPGCLRRMIEKHEALAQMFRTRLGGMS